MHMTALLILPLLLLVYIGLCFPQYFLSKKENKWYGVLIPSLSLLASLICAAVAGGRAEDIYIFIIAFALLSIPTTVYFIIYAICRENLRKKRFEIKKIDIDNL